MRRKSTVFVAFALAASAAIAAVAAGVGFGGPRTPTLSEEKASALERPVRLGDALPPRVLELPFARHFANVTAARRVLHDAERTVYAVPGRDSSLCLVVVESNSSIGLNCAGRSVLRSGAVWQGSGNADGSTDIVGVTGDGVAYFRADGQGKIAIKDNVFAIDGVKAKTLVFGTKNGLEAEFDLGTLSRVE